MNTSYHNFIIDESPLSQWLDHYSTLSVATGLLSASQQFDDLPLPVVRSVLWEISSIINVFGTKASKALLTRAFKSGKVKTGLAPFWCITA